MKPFALIVDNDQITREILSLELAEFGIEVIWAPNDEEGFRNFLEIGPKIIFIEVLIPRHGGLSLLKKIRSAKGGENVPVFMLSVLSQNASIRSEAIDDLHAIDYIRKPLQIKKLHDKLTRLLNFANADNFELVNPFEHKLIADRGSLDSLDFSVLLKNLAEKKATAHLNLSNGKTKKILCMRDGKITFALSNRLAETLGRHLIASGRIDESTIRAGRDITKKFGFKMGEFLVSEGYLETNEMHEAVRKNIHEKIIEIFSWQGGRYSLSSYHEPPTELPGKPFKTREILWDGIKKVLPMERIVAALAPIVRLPIRAKRNLIEIASEAPLDNNDLLFIDKLRTATNSAASQTMFETREDQEKRLLYYLFLQNYLSVPKKFNSREDAKAANNELSSQNKKILEAKRSLMDCQGRNFFQILEAPLDSSDKEIWKAYIKKAKEFHPDSLNSEDSEEITSLYNDLFNLANIAYEGLKTDNLRKEHLAMIQELPKQDKKLSADDVLKAEMLFRQGQIHLKQRSWLEAEKAFTQALSLNPEENEYCLGVGKAKLHQAAAGNSEALAEAETILKKALHSLPKSPDSAFYLGRLETIKGNHEQAAFFFQAALRINANHLEAQRELRLIAMRAEKKRRAM